MQQFFSAHLTTLPAMLHFVTSQALKLGFKAEEWLPSQVAMDEALTNVIQHAELDSRTQLEIQCHASSKKLGIEVVIIDQGKPFNPLLHGRAQSAEGGFGLPLMRALLDEMTYKRENNCNRLTLIKYLQR